MFYYTKQKNQGPQICEGKYEGLDVLCSLRLLNPKSVAGNNGCGGGPGKAVCFEEIAAQFYMLLPSVQSGKWTLSLPFYTLSFSWSVLSFSQALSSWNFPLCTWRGFWYHWLITCARELGNHDRVWFQHHFSGWYLIPATSLGSNITPLWARSQWQPESGAAKERDRHKLIVRAEVLNTQPSYLPTVNVC